MRLRAFLDDGSPLSLSRSHADTLGVVLSCACAVHCVALPLALVAFPAVRATLGVAGGESAEWAFVAASAVMGAWALGWRGWRVHAQRRPLTWFMVGLALVLAGHRVEDAIGRPASAIVVAGAAAIVTAHVRNRRLDSGGGNARVPSPCLITRRPPTR